MMEMKWDGREVIVRLRDDVWQLEEPGTLNLTRTQAQMLRVHLNQLAVSHNYEQEPEDG